MAAEYGDPGQCNDEPVQFDDSAYPFWYGVDEGKIYGCASEGYYKDMIEVSRFLIGGEGGSDVLARGQNIG
tara:strand:- start:1577 stop:1789 length:213 start_codon:yes stop_codon:yes gene_type:complete